MLPFIPPGSAVEVERVSPEKVKTGDVVCYIDESAWGLTHRVIHVERRDGRLLFSVRGDAQKHCREVTSTALVYIVRRVRFRRFSYDCDGDIGQLISGIAISDAVPQRITRNTLAVLWEMASKFRKLYRIIR
jgi:hypothetical protein